MTHDLHLMRKVRNKFAHELRDTSFKSTDPPIADWNNSLKMQFDLGDKIRDAMGSEDRYRFLSCMTANTFGLIAVVMRNLIASQYLTQYADEIAEKTKVTLKGIKPAEVA